MTIDTDDAYSAARIRAARSRRIGRAEYERLMRMSDAEIISYLQASAYRSEVDALGVKDLTDLEAVDRIIAQHEDAALRWLARISTPSYGRIIDVLYHENDVWNIRVVAEAIVGGTSVDEAIALFARPGSVPAQAYASARTLADLARLASTRLRGMASAPDDLAGFLDALERAQAAKAVPQTVAGALIIDERNLARVLRCARDGVPADRAVSGTSRGGRLSRGILRRIASAKDAAESLRILLETPYREAAQRAAAAGDEAPLRIEVELHRAVLQALARTAHADPLGPGLLGRHIADAGMESANLRLLIKARRLGLDEAFVRDRLVVP